MAAGLGFKEFITGDVLTAADANGFLASQVVMVFDDAAARTAAITSPQEGMITYLKDTDQVQTYSGSAYVTVGGGSPLTTKGDLYTFSTTDARLGVGTNNQVLVADSSTGTGLKWANPAGGGGLVYVGGAPFTASSAQSFNNVFTSTYENYMVIVNIEQSTNVTNNFRLRVGGSDNTTSDYFSTSTFNQIDAAGGDTDSKSSATTSWQTNNVGNLNQVFYISRPQLALKTVLSSVQTAFNFSANFYTGRVSGLFNATTSFDGFSFFPGSGTITGNIRIYGIVNS